MAKRYSGEVVVRILYNDQTQQYDAWVSWPNGRAKVAVGLPAFMTTAVDSSAGYDNAARAAIAFVDIPGEYHDREGVHASIRITRKSPKCHSR